MDYHLILLLQYKNDFEIFAAIHTLFFKTMSQVNTTSKKISMFLTKFKLLSSPNCLLLKTPQPVLLMLSLSFSFDSTFSSSSFSQLPSFYYPICSLGLQLEISVRVEFKNTVHCFVTLKPQTKHRFNTRRTM